VWRSIKECRLPNGWNLNQQGNRGEERGENKKSAEKGQREQA